MRLVLRPNFVLLVGQDALNRAHAQLAAVLAADDSEHEDGSSKQRAKRPGAITPLGVRVDKGPGLLGENTAASTLSEMDSAISGIRQW
eukprot:gene19377-26026_t